MLCAPNVRQAIAALLLWAMAGAAAAQAALKEPETGVEFPGRTAFNGRLYDAVRTSNVRTRVLGIRTWAIAVGYYLEAGSFDRNRELRSQLVAAGSAKLLVLAFVRTVPATATRELLEAGLARQMPGGRSPSERRSVDALMAAIDDMKRGEVIQLVWLPSGELEMLVKGVTRARVRDAAIAQALWEIFLA